MAELDPEADLALVPRLRAGDERAFQEAHDRHADAVYNAALRMLGDRALAADLTQEVFLTLYQRADEIQDGRRLRAWLLVTATRRSIDWWRARKGEASLDLPQVRRAAERPDTGASPLEAALARDEEERLSRALLELSPVLRECLVLRYLQGLSYEEIAAALGLSMGTVKSRLFRAHEALAERLGGGSATRE